MTKQIHGTAQTHTKHHDATNIQNKLFLCFSNFSMFILIADFLNDLSTNVYNVKQYVYMRCELKLDAISLRCILVLLGNCYFVTLSFQKRGIL